MDAGLAGENRGEFLATPLRMAGAVLEGVLVDEPIEVGRQRAGHFGGCVANFAQEVVKGQLLLAVGRIRRPGSRTIRLQSGPCLPPRPPAVVS